ncbi:MAG: acyl-ACP--UDP-N-acetylglucosamine O-acyltransferase [Deltaproteobacteria bacterium]|nr:acyl-ACP--UDP-N-acetylglucosamine O-acyltransferase [Deltaproteobacteria bacterium]
MSGAQIHPTAVVAPTAALADGVTVGPYAVVGPRVQLGAGTSVGAHAVVEGLTRLGARNQIFAFAAVGTPPQDLKFHGEDSRLEIGDDNRIREFATLQPGTEGGGMLTRVGNGNLLMNYTHIAHDCIVGDRTIIANGTQLGGHVTIESFAVLGALSAVHQFARVGESAIVGAGSMVSQDVPPFCNATGDRATLHGLNLLGLKRRGIEADVVRALRRAYAIMFRHGLRVAAAAAQIRAELAAVPEVERFVAFVEASQRGVCREGRRKNPESTDEH